MTGSDGQPCDSVCASLGCTDGCSADGPGGPTPVAGSDGQQERNEWEARAAALREMRVREVDRRKAIVTYLEEQLDDAEHAVTRDERDLQRFDEAVASQRAERGWSS